MVTRVILYRAKGSRQSTVFIGAAGLIHAVSQKGKCFDVECNASFCTGLVRAATQACQQGILAQP